MTIAAVVLAAGASTRLGEPKQLLRDHKGETLLHKIAREALDAGVHPVVVVVGSNAEHIQEAVSDLRVEIHNNEYWAQGISTSIRAGAAAVGIKEDTHLSGILFVTCDMPSVGKMHLQRLIDASENGEKCVASTYGDTIGIPAIVPKTELLKLQSLHGDKGAKELFRRDGTVSVPLIDGSFDLDTPEDVERWRATGSQ